MFRTLGDGSRGSRGRAAGNLRRSGGRGGALVRRSAGGREGGFTLIELLVVVAIIGILMALLFPAIYKAWIEGKITACKNNLHEIQRGFMLYMNQHGSHKYFPPGGDVDLVNGLFARGREPVLEDFELLVCPLKGSAPASATPVTAANCDYLFKNGGTPTVSALANLPPTEILAIDKPDNHGTEANGSHACYVRMDGKTDVIRGDSAEIDPVRARVMLAGKTK